MLGETKKRVLIHSKTVPRAAPLTLFASLYLLTIHQATRRKHVGDD